MLLKYFYNEKLSHASYLVGCQATGEAIIIDPNRDLAPYLNTAKAEGLTVIAVAETHIHADFLSGSLELAASFGSQLYLSGDGDETGKYQFIDHVKSTLLHDMDTIQIGHLQLKAIHTPGHTSEHMSYLLTDRGADVPIGIFTGDFVFVGDVGRPDLNEKALGIVGSSEKNARKLFHSLKKFKQLPDFLQVWPSHGAGSACGKALGAIPSSTVGYEKRFNWALKCEDEEEFVSTLLKDQPAPPKYFSIMKRLNKEGPQRLSDVSVPKKLEVGMISEYNQRDVQLLDTRSAHEFATGHLPGSINIPYNRSFIQWAGWLLRYDKPVYVIAENTQLDSLIKDLCLIGIDHIEGYLDSEFLKLEQNIALQTYREMIPLEISEKVKNQEVLVIDVRFENEWDQGHLPQAHHIMLGHLPDRIHEIPTDKPILLQCRSGIRSAIAASILQANGIPQVYNLVGGYNEWIKNELPIVKKQED